MSNRLSEETMLKRAAKQVSRARIGLMSHQPFFAPVLVIVPSIAEQKNTKTMGTNGLSIFYNPKWVLQQNHEKLLFVIAHEVMHIILLHHTRRHGRDPKIWNYAGDFVINPLVKDTTFYPLPDDALYDEKYAGMNTEQVYEDLKNNCKSLTDKLTEEAENGNPLPGEILPYPGELEDVPPVEEHEAEIKHKARDSLKRAGKEAGKLPDSLTNMIKGLMRPILNWKAILAMYMQTDNSDYSWNRPDRRFISQNIYMPAKWGESVGAIGFVVDTSGSISEKEYTHFMSEFLALVNGCKPSSLHYLQIDSAIAHEKEYTTDDYPITIIPEIHGGGGTSFEPAFDYFHRKGIQLQCLVYMTDLYCSDFGKKPPFPVLWINTSVDDRTQENVPWGTVIDLKLDVGEA